jgi:hypothetical protein
MIFRAGRKNIWPSVTTEDAEDTETRTLGKLDFRSVSSVSPVVESQFCNVLLHQRSS